MKRIGLSVLFLALLFLAACTGASDPPATIAPTAAPPTATSQPTAVPTEEAVPTAEAVPNAEPTTEPTATEEPSPEPTATDEPTPAPAPTGTPSPEPTTTVEASGGQPAGIVIGDFSFSPENITVKARARVSWSHLGRAPHTVTADDGTFDSGSLSDGDTFDFTFSTAGTYAYYCKIHGGPGQSGMSALITVTD